MFLETACGSGPIPLTTVTASTLPPGIGSVLVVAAGRYSGSTRSAAYSVPRCVEVSQLQSALIGVNGCIAVGCTHQIPFTSFVYTTIFSPALAPFTRPATALSVPAPPWPVGGTVAN